MRSDLLGAGIQGQRCVKVQTQQSLASPFDDQPDESPVNGGAEQRSGTDLSDIQIQDFMDAVDPQTDHRARPILAWMNHQYR